MIQIDMIRHCSQLAQKNNIQTFQNHFLDIEPYGIDGSSIKMLFWFRLLQFRNSYGRMNRAAFMWWWGFRSFRSIRSGVKLAGTEAVMDVIKKFGWEEQNELDGFIRFVFIDYEFALSDVAVSDFGGIYRKTQAMVIDQRGFDTIPKDIASRNEISPIFHTKVR
jgi:hypothetical protein